jgi:hypothetical protein
MLQVDKIAFERHQMQVRFQTQEIPSWNQYLKHTGCLSQDSLQNTD